MADTTFWKQVFPACHLAMGQTLWTDAEHRGDHDHLDAFPSTLQQVIQDRDHLAFLPDLARLEIAVHRLQDCRAQRGKAGIKVNPCLELLELEWTNLWTMIPNRRTHPPLTPEYGSQRILVWQDTSGRVRCRPATEPDLAALKLVTEGISVPEAAAQTGYPQSRIWPILHKALREDILLQGESLIRRAWSIPAELEKYQAAQAFTLQWHITQACDLNCRHCYGREARDPLRLEQAMDVLDDFDHFCRTKNVHGQVSFTGGNPMLHPQLDTIFEEAVNRGFTVGFLGNPTSRERLQSLLHKGPITFYQISLEGLEEHNDYIRGPGHFQRSLQFLDILRELGIYSMVMLTLTQANTGQVLDLARELEGRADLFTFNRLSTVGSGAYLTPADREEFTRLLAAYQAQAKEISGMGFKDNLFNVYRSQHDLPLFGGCTGYGCGAAFNFVALLCDGEVHACRKFPSPLGNIHDHCLEEIYDSELADSYRQGPSECQNCRLRPVCRGCLAVIHSCGKDVFTARDPYCCSRPDEPNLSGGIERLR
jgi:selenobiotic family peptide radical SAM maturase